MLHTYYVRYRGAVLSAVHVVLAHLILTARVYEVDSS